jgi:hypothetical protein
MALDPPLVNGNKHSFAEIEVSLDGDRLLGIQAVNYDDTLEPGIVPGTSAQSIGRTLGEYKCTASIDVVKASADAWRKKHGDGWMTKVFPMVVNYQVADGDPLITDEVRHCRVTKAADSHSKGTDGLIEKWDIQPLVIIRNGIHPLPEDSRLY